MINKYTKYYRVKEGNRLIKAVNLFAVKYSIKYKNSEKYFRTTLKLKNKEKKVKIQINVLRIPKEEQRGLEGIRKTGSYTLFLDTFNKLKDYLKTQKEDLEKSRDN